MLQSSIIDIFEMLMKQVDEAECYCLMMLELHSESYLF